MIRLATMESRKKIAKLHGSIVALVTPVVETPPHDLDIEALKRLVAWHIDEGSDGLVVMGTTGESPTITAEEWKKVVSVCVGAAGGRVPVIAGTGKNCTAATIEQTCLASSLGADAALVVTPYYNKPTQQGLVAHFSAVAAATPQLPIITYNVPGRTACDLEPETLAQIVKQHPNVMGHKEASGDIIEKCKEIKQQLGDTFRVFSGEDTQTCEAMLNGVCDGVITVAGNVMPKLVRSMCMHAYTGDRKNAQALNNKLRALYAALFIEPNPTAAKWLLADMKKIPGGIRLPLLPLSQEHHETVRQAFKDATAEASS